VLGIDVDEKKIEKIRNSICPFYDPPLQKNLEEAVNKGKLIVSAHISKTKSDVIILTVGTPSLEGSADYSQLYSAINEICITDIFGKLIILRSTLPPKTTEDIIIPMLEKKTNLKCGKDFALAVCPERILEGKAIQEINDLPEIIGGVNKISSEIAKEVFLAINNKKEILFISPTGAELAKLFTNIYRYNIFALANEFAVWSELYGVDGTEVIKVANHNYERCNIPIPGFAGGPCLSKDSIFLANNTVFASIVSAAWKLNESIPTHIVNNIKEIMGNLFDKKIAVLGIAFKGGSDDLRNSPSVKLVDILKTTGAKIHVHDPHVKDTETLEKVLNYPDIVIIATNHKEFIESKEKIHRSKPKLIYDVWGLFNQEDFLDSRYIKFGQSIKN
ncbi:MAG: nucleotide sugar dehydrogenase, partial [Candidatus Nitrosopelagicus sp.]|nr:nucleotide sugar dehydrogenase [Candidatus Nitrosopelagicus sp.]